MNSNYSILFTIELLHEYFLTRECNDFEIVPASDCKALFSRAKIICRHTDNKLIAFIEQNDSGEPSINTASEKNYRKDFSKDVFRFYLKLKNPLFSNYTNINCGAGKKVCFSNLSQNNNSGFLFLSAPVSPFAPDKLYFPGDLAKDPRSGKVYEALKKYTAKKKTELSDPTVWCLKGLFDVNNNIQDFTPGKTYVTGNIVKQPKTDSYYEAIQKHTAASIAELNDPLLWISRGQGQLQYTGENDVTECCGSHYNFTISGPVTKAEITVSGFNFNPAAPGLDLPVKAKETLTFNSPVTGVAVDLQSLKPGKYAIKVNSETRIIYYDPAINAANCFGVIEIFNFLPASDDYALLTEDEKIKKTNYHVLFASRKVLWKYIRKDGRAQTITDTGTTAYQFALLGNGFVSSAPIPLSENVLKTLTLEFNTNDFKLSPLPNPTPERFARCNQNDYDYLCSEIYLNY